MEAQIPVLTIVPVIPARPDESKRQRHELNPEKSPEEEDTNHAAERGNELVLNRLIVHHGTVMHKDMGIKSKGDATGEHKRTGRSGHNRTLSARQNPDQKDRPQQSEDVRLCNRDEERNSRPKRPILLQI